MDSGKAKEAIKALVEALRELGLAQSRMLDKWAEGDDAVKKELWKALHSCEDKWREALTHAPALLKWCEEMERRHQNPPLIAEISPSGQIVLKKIPTPPGSEA